MRASTNLQMILVRSRMLELRAEAAEARRAATARTANGGGGVRHRRGLVAAGAAIGRDGLVEGTGEPVAQAQPTATKAAIACAGASSGRGAAG